MKVNICGIPYRIKYKRVINESEPGIGEGLIIYRKQTIYLRKKLGKQIREETLIHEMVHGILIHIGKSELANDEEFVQMLAHCIYQSFKVKKVKQ